jgi:hypothetical protein
VKHVPGNSGVSGCGVDNLALDALPTVPLYEANRGGGARGVDPVALGALPTAVLLRPRAGLSGSGLYTAPGRAVFLSPFARPVLCALSRVRGTSGGETMTTPGGAGTPYEHATYPPCSAHRLLSWGRSSLAQGSGPSLCTAPMPQRLSYVH